MRILGLDLGTNTGWATMELDEEDRIHIHQTNCYRLKNMMELHGSVGRWVGFLLLLSEYGGDCDFIAYENVPSAVHVAAGAARVYGGLFATLELFCKEHHKELVPVTIQAVKKAMTGSRKADKRMMVRAAKERFGTVPIVDDNQADAMGVCLAAFQQLRKEGRG